MPKTENLADLAHYFLKNGGIIPHSKNGGDASPVPLLRSPWVSRGARRGMEW